MGQKQPLLIGKLSFKTKLAATQHIRALLDTMPWGVPLGGEIHHFVSSLLDKHPGAREKVGCGVDHLSVNADNMGKRCFWVTRKDGTREHFSYISCLNGYDWTKDVRGAMRKAINPQILRFRDRHLSEHSICPLTGERISQGNCHVDHDNPTFDELHRAWLSANGLGYEDVKLTDGTGNEIGREMSDLSQKASWFTFHEQKAKLRLLSPKGNLTRSKNNA